MSTIAQVNIRTLLEKYKLNLFCETGTGDGISLDHIKHYQEFKIIRSCEIEEASFKLATNRFAHDPQIKILHIDSESFTRGVGEGRQEEDVILWWLDAHFPGVDTGFKTHQDNINLPIDLQIPTVMELLNIHKSNKYQKDVILIDDAFFFRTGTYSIERPTNLPGFMRQALGSLERTLALFEPTHDISVDPNSTGIICLTPKLSA